MYVITVRLCSNFGTNLTVTSSYVWENLFAILISVIGLLLFLYLIGNVQVGHDAFSSNILIIRAKRQIISDLRI